LACLDAWLVGVAKLKRNMNMYGCSQKYALAPLIAGTYAEHTLSSCPEKVCKVCKAWWTACAFATNASLLSSPSSRGANAASRMWYTKLSNYICVHVYVYVHVYVGDGSNATSVARIDHHCHRAKHLSSSSEPSGSNFVDSGEHKG